MTQIEYKFRYVYKFLDIVYDGVATGVDYWNFDSEQFVQSASKFNKCSILHLYVAGTLNSYYRSLFRKNEDCYSEFDVEWWRDIMDEYGVSLCEADWECTEDDTFWNWYERNEENFMQFFSNIADELVHILFNDRQFLVAFNRLTREVLIDSDKVYKKFVFWPEGVRNEDGTIKRCTIPQWVKNAVYHRDKGHCVFCNRDLTGLVNVLHQKNFDHIIPLKDYGTNDPCNMQLSCEECNKKKGAKDIVPNYKYQQWW